MASCSEQFLKVSWNSVQWSSRSSGLEIGRDELTDRRTNGRTLRSLYTPETTFAGGIIIGLSIHCQYGIKHRSINQPNNWSINLFTLTHITLIGIWWTDADWIKMDSIRINGHFHPIFMSIQCIFSIWNSSVFHIFNSISLKTQSNRTKSITATERIEMLSVQH